jgi:Zn-dependent protease with chaperone function
VGYLLHIVLALFAQALDEEGLGTAADMPWLVLALASVPYVLATLARSSALKGHFSRSGVLLAALHWCPPVLHAAAVLACGWNRTLERWIGAPPRLFGWPEPHALLALAPLVLYTLLAIDARVRVVLRQGGAATASRRFQMRVFVSAAAPLALYVLLATLIGRWPAARARIDQVELYAALFALALVLLFLAALPFLLSWTWDTRPLERGPLRAELEALAYKARFRCRDVLVWRTGQQLTNAAVVGIAPRLRVVLLTDALLSELDLSETRAVFAHEIGHARRHHALVFVAWSAAFFMGIDLLAARWMSDDAWTAGGLLLAALALWYVGFGWLSRRFELDADVFSAELLGDVEPMIRALLAVGGPHTGRKHTWRHFSPGQRIEFLQRLPAEPQLGMRLQRRLRALAWTGVALAAVALAGESVAIAQAFPADSVRAELALGRYAQASARLARVARADEDLARQVNLAANLERADGVPSADELFDKARAELARGDLSAAGDLLELASLRGLDQAGDMLAELGELDDDGASWEAVATEIEPRWPDWSAAVRSAARALSERGP